MESLLEIKKYKLYAPGPFKVFIESALSSSQNVTRIHSVSLGKIFYLSKVPDIIKIGNLGKNRICALFKTPTAANNFLTNPLLADNNLKAFIPTHCISRTGIIRDIDPSLDENTILEYIQSSVKVTRVRRINRRVRSTPLTPSSSSSPIYVPSYSVVLTFEGTVLPKHVSLFYNSRDVEVYIHPVKQCYKCLRFGHTMAHCRSVFCCSRCGENHETKSCLKDPMEPKVYI